MPTGRGGAREGRRWGGYFCVNNQEKTRGNRQNMNYKKLGMEGGGEVVEENALTEMTLRKLVYLYKDLSSTYTVITRIDKFFVI